MTDPVQAALNDVRPLFQGHRPKHAQDRFTGTSVETHNARQLDQQVILVAVGLVRGIAHKRDKDGVLGRFETVEIVEAHELGPDLDGDAVISQARQATKELEARVRGYEEPSLDDQLGDSAYDDLGGQR